MDRSLYGLDTTGLCTTVGLADASVLGDVVDTLNDDAVALGENLNYLALLATVSAASLGATSDDLNQVTLLDVRLD